jgi:hypothetical protein
VIACPYAGNFLGVSSGYGVSSPCKRGRKLRSRQHLSSSRGWIVWRIRKPANGSTQSSDPEPLKVRVPTTVSPHPGSYMLFCLSGSLQLTSSDGDTRSVLMRDALFGNGSDDRARAKAIVIERTGLACAASGDGRAISSDSPLPINPEDVGSDPGALERLHAICCQLSPVLARARVLAGGCVF